MFNVGPLELAVLVIVGVLVVGPDKLPGLAKDAARMLRSLRELATGARQQLREELGPEFADIDLRNFNPRHVVSRAVFGDGELPDFSKYDPRRFDARSAANSFFSADDAGEEPEPTAGVGVSSVDFTTTAPAAPPAPPVGERPRPRPRPRPAEAPRSYDGDIT